MKKICVLALTGLLLFLPASPAQATSLHWKREAHPLVITIYDQTNDSLWSAAIQKLTKEWNAGITGIQFVASLDPADCDTGHGAFTVVVCVKENRSEDHVGEAALYSDGAHLTQVTIWMDPRPDPARNHLACHELGHALGVQHREASSKSCMIDGYQKRYEHPDQRDFDGVILTYSHIH